MLPQVVTTGAQILALPAQGLLSGGTLQAKQTLVGGQKVLTLIPPTTSVSEVEYLKISSRSLFMKY